MGEAVRELKSDTSESYDLKAISEIAIENEAFSSKNSLKNAVEYRDNFQSVSSRHLENEFSDGLGGKNSNITSSFSAVPDCQSSIGSVLDYNIQAPTVAAVIFRSKHHGWKSYMMKIQIAEKKRGTDARRQVNDIA